MGSPLAFLSCVFTTLLFIVNHGHSTPVGNTTSFAHREQKGGVKFPLETKSSEWSRISHMNASRTPASGSDTTFVFPDDLPPIQFTPKISKKSPTCSEDNTFCESVDDYPEDYLQKVLSNKIDEYQAIMGVDELKSPDITQRIDGIDENPLCASVEQIVYPKTAKNKDEKWLYVINQPPYTQGVRIEKCLKTGDSGSTSCLFVDQLPLGYKTVCKQKFIYRKLVALDENGSTVTDTFQLPSCCSCTVQSNPLHTRLAPMKNSSKVTTSKPKKES